MNTTTTTETTTKATAAERMQEAVKRLYMLNLHPNVLKDFKRGRSTVPTVANSAP